MKKSNYLPTLRKRTATLISKGARTVGFDCGYMIEESLYCDEADSVFAFLAWLQKNWKFAGNKLPAFVEANYPVLYKNHFLKTV